MSSVGDLITALNVMDLLTLRKARSVLVAGADNMGCLYCGKKVNGGGAFCGVGCMMAYDFYEEYD